MRVNFENKSIVITKAESKSASNFGSELFNQIAEVRRQFPEFKIVVKATPKKKDAFKGLDYDYMIKYIEAHKETSEKNLLTFANIRGFETTEDMKMKKKGMADEAKYAEVRAWFLNTYPEVADFNNEVQKMREQIKMATAARKAMVA